MSAPQPATDVPADPQPNYALIEVGRFVQALSVLNDVKLLAERPGDYMRATLNLLDGHRGVYIPPEALAGRGTPDNDPAPSEPDAHPAIAAAAAQDKITDALKAAEPATRGVRRR